ncbi:Motility protein B [Fervidicola ferrireducens]|uniref:Motility protein B n=1 Tax=Fervidicola ferrireducens TaxID=520764 RepID=A0A140LAP4_9FIRM|nr:OmpA family protein [Fervidicola ferrireducens]KXG77619.1 Motility protein B [Fervidicola ferrireducens]
MLKAVIALPGARRRKSEDAPPPGAPLWMTTYGDLITQTLIFFVLLFALSNVDAKKFDLAITSVQGSLGILEGGKSLIEGEFVEEGLAGENLFTGEQQEEKELKELGDTILEIVKRSGYEGVTVSIDERGLAVRFMEGVLFDSGKADLKSEAIRLLDKIAPVLKQSRRPIRVEGHTDNVPIHTREFPTNWELSTARAVSVLRYLVENHGIPPRMISAAGYGEYHPIAPNDTDQNRSRNRRVEIIILSSSLMTQEPK